MSPGVTFERVYFALKRMLTERELPPGTPIEPAHIGRQIAASITPVRDALHRLTGERLVEAPNHNGFRVPLPTETALRDLYQWNGQLLGLAVKAMRFEPEEVSTGGGTRQDDIGTATAALFLRIAAATGSDEHAKAIALLNDRLAPFRRVEGELLNDLAVELTRLREATEDSTQLARLITAYHRRRARMVSDILSFKG